MPSRGMSASLILVAVMTSLVDVGETQMKQQRLNGPLNDVDDDDLLSFYAASPAETYRSSAQAQGHFRHHHEPHLTSSTSLRPAREGEEEELLLMPPRQSQFAKSVGDSDFLSQSYTSNAPRALSGAYQQPQQQRSTDVHSEVADNALLLVPSYNYVNLGNVATLQDSQRQPGVSEDDEADSRNENDADSGRDGEVGTEHDGQGDLGRGDTAATGTGDEYGTVGGKRAIAPSLGGERLKLLKQSVRDHYLRLLQSNPNASWGTRDLKRERSGGGATLSVESSLDVIRQRYQQELRRRQQIAKQKQIESNGEILSSIGKRNVRSSEYSDSHNQVNKHSSPSSPSHGLSVQQQH